MTRVSRRGTVFATVAMGTVMAVASAAFACGSWRGSFTVEGDAALGALSVSNGDGTGMFRCATGNQWGAKANGIQDQNVDGDRIGWIKVQTGISTCGGTNDRLVNGLYTINLVWGVPEEMIGLSDCMNVTRGTVTSGFGTKVLGVVEVGGTSGGLVGPSPVVVNGVGTFDLVGPDDDTGNLLPGQTMVCISHAQGHINNQTVVELV